MKYNCELIQDLLPIYHDKALSEVSNKIVEKHIHTCAICKQYSEDIESSIKDTHKEINNTNINTTLFAKNIKRIRKIILTAFIIILLSLIAAISFIIYLDISETPSQSFTNYSEAQDLVQRGWIPANIPIEATDIFVIYNIDSNVINGSFNLPKSSNNTFVYSCTPAISSQFKSLPQSLKSEWENSKNLIYTNDSSVTDYTLLQNDSFLFALSPSGHVLFWSK